MRFLSFEKASGYLRGHDVAIVGSGPTVLANEPGFIDSHDVVVRVNNYKLGDAQGRRTDVFYSFFGSSIRKTAAELARDGVYLCMAKCPDAKPIDCAWHEKQGRENGVDFRYIYRMRRDFWFCDTYIPTVERFLHGFDLLDRHVPTTGFAAILEVLACEPRSLYLTGFDFFTSGVHNVDEKWRPGDDSDPIGHRPDLEAAWLRRNAGGFPIVFDAKLQELCA